MRKTLFTEAAEWRKRPEDPEEKRVFRKSRVVREHEPNL
jgi:hypothetical protein